LESRHARTPQRDRLVLARSSLGGSSEHPEIRYSYETWGPLALAKHFFIAVSALGGM
jgi:hypothetical protein